jgi:uncharacterized protein (TIGR00106 family)
MIAEFSITPLQTEHLSKDIAKVAEILKHSGLPYKLGPMGTCVEGDLENVLAAIRRCHEAIASHHERVFTTITIDDRKTHAHHLNDMVTSVEHERHDRIVAG